MPLSKKEQLAQVFTVSNLSEHFVRCLLEAIDGGWGEEFLILPRAEKVVNMTLQRGLISVAICENDGTRSALAICKERVPVEAGIPFFVNSHDRHPGNRRCEMTLVNTTDFVRTFAKMSLARALAEPHCPAVTQDLIQIRGNNTLSYKNDRDHKEWPTSCLASCNTDHVLYHKHDFLIRRPTFAKNMASRKAGQMAQVFTVVNRTGHHVKCLLEAIDEGRDEFLLLPIEEKVVNRRSQRGLLSVAFCENDGSRFTFAICHERVPIEAGIPFFVNPQDRHPGNLRYGMTLVNATDLVRTFAKMSLARALAEIGCTLHRTPPMIAQPWPEGKMHASEVLCRSASLGGLPVNLHHEENQARVPCKLSSSLSLPNLKAAP